MAEATILRSPHPDVDIPDTPLVPFVLGRVSEFPDHLAIICGVTGKSYTYAQLADAVHHVAAGLHAHGIRKGDVVGLVSPNLPDFPVVFYAAASIGAICSTVNPIATAEEIGAQFADSEALMIVTIPELFEKCAAAARLASTVREIIVFGEADGATPYRELFAHGNTPPIVEIDPAVDVAALPYSSGTSGIPKGVMLTHRNIVANLLQMQAITEVIDSDSRVLGVLPFFHIYGMVVVMGGALRQGACIVSLPRFDLEQVLRVLQDHKIRMANVVPPILLALAKHPIVANYDLSHLKYLFSGAAPLGAELASACQTRLGITVRQGYGLTETSPVTHFHPMDDRRVVLQSVGPSAPNTECRLVDPATGHDCAPGEPGELWMRGPQVMKGYFNKPEATAASMTDDGWFKTGDIAVVDEQGWYQIVDRVKELIKYKGLQVAPAELEALLLGHPGIADAAVIPVPDPDAGEIPKAFVVLRSPLTAEQVMAFIAERVSSYKKVRQVEFVDAIPKSPSGKILRRLLVEQERKRVAATSDTIHPSHP
ncbi:4-coumarate--CoA ligase family protein [Gemmatimonas sp.]|uniref:4-coumarate--CoA ligase family protein n=1 Tax=Gemmatimonas sp. TaxID=1962908 RepID=UPI003569096F